MKHQKLRLGQTKIYYIVLSSLVMERFMPIAYGYTNQLKIP